jgi:small-conductance mechanosensitive channel
MFDQNIFYYTKPIIIFLIVFTIYLVIKSFLRRALIKKVQTKKMKHNITISLNILTYIFIALSVVGILLYFSGGSLSLGLTAGLLSAALGWALQRPITGVAGWVMVVLAKPFTIGDRIIIGATKGDVSNITLSHIYLREFGGTTGGEETSGRIIMIPNSVLFEKDVINYTLQDDYILDEVAFTITYESDLNEARKIAINAAKKAIKEFLEKTPSNPNVRFNFQSSGVDVRLRYYTIAEKRQKFNSEITEEIFNKIKKTEGIRFAYPHTEVILNKK